MFRNRATSKTVIPLSRRSAILSLVDTTMSLYGHRFELSTFWGGLATKPIKKRPPTLRGGGSLCGAYLVDQSAFRKTPFLETSVG